MDTNANGAASPEPGEASAVARAATDGTVTTSAPANGDAAPLTLDELRAIAPGERSPRQKRRLSILEKKAKADAAKEKRAARRPAVAEPAAVEPAQKSAEPDDDERDDEQRSRETGGFWRLVLRVVSLAMWPFGYELGKLDGKACDEDVALLLPLVKRHAWLDVLVKYAALPYLLVERVVGLARRREVKGKTNA